MSMGLKSFEDEGEESRSPLRREQSSGVNERVRGGRELRGTVVGQGCDFAGFATGLLAS